MNLSHMKRGVCLLLLLSLAACGAAGLPSASPVSSPSAQPMPSASPVSSLSTEPIPPDSGSPSAEPGANITTANPLLRVRLTGGMCMNGGCWAVREIGQDGSFVIADGTGMQANGTLDPALLEEIKAQMAQTDFEQLQAQPFTGTCPLAYDGQEATYTFYTAAGEETFSNCQVNVDPMSPLFQTIEQALTLMTQQS